MLSTMRRSPGSMTFGSPIQHRDNQRIIPTSFPNSTIWNYLARSPDIGGQRLHRAGWRALAS